MKRPEKVLLIISKLGKGGAQTIVLELANALVNEGVAVDILLFFRTPQDRTYVERLDRRVGVVFLTQSPTFVSSDFKAVWSRVAQYVKIPFLALLWALQGRLDRYDIVHSHLLGASFLSWVFSLLYRMSNRKSPAWVETFHADLTSITVTEKQLFGFFWKHLDVLVTELTSKDYEEIASTLKKTDVRYIPFGVSTPIAAKGENIAAFMRLVGEPTDKPVLVTITRLNILEKRVDKLLEVIAAVKAKHGENFVCLLCGDGPDAEVLRAYAHDLDLDNQVRFIGFVDDVALPLGAARLFFVAGIEDLVGIAGLQAALLGIPVVSWQVASGWQGPRRFFWSEHHVDQVADELCRLLEDDGYHREASIRDRQVAKKHFSVEAMVKGYMAVYNDVRNS